MLPHCTTLYEYLCMKSLNVITLQHCMSICVLHTMLATLIVAGDNSTDLMKLFLQVLQEGRDHFYC